MMGRGLRGSLWVAGVAVTVLAASGSMSRLVAWRQHTCVKKLFAAAIQGVSTRTNVPLDIDRLLAQTDCGLLRRRFRIHAYDQHVLGGTEDVLIAAESLEPGGISYALMKDGSTELLRGNLSLWLEKRAGEHAAGGDAR